MVIAQGLLRPRARPIPRIEGSSLEIAELSPDESSLLAAIRAGTTLHVDSVIKSLAAKRLIWRVHARSPWMLTVLGEITFDARRLP